jgi:hypothetical protein
VANVVVWALSCWYVVIVLLFVVIIIILVVNAKVHVVIDIMRFSI